MKQNLKIIMILLASLMIGSAKAQIINTIAGNGTAGFSGDGGPAILAELYQCLGVCVDPAGNVYTSDVQNYVIRKIDPSGIITTIAGTPGTPGYSGDGGPAVSATLNSIFGIVFDKNTGNLYLSSNVDNVVRMIDPSGIITTVAGNGTAGYSGNGGSAVAAELNAPTGLAVDAASNLYIADMANSVIRKVNTSGIISTVAGNNVFGNTGDGGAALSAELGDPTGVAVDPSNNLYISDIWYNSVRKVDASGIINMYAGTSGTGGYTGDGGPAVGSRLAYPFHIAADNYGNLFISHGGYGVIRKVDASGTITTYAGTGTPGFSGDGGPADLAQLNPQNIGVAVDAADNVYVGDYLNERVRKISTGSCIDDAYLSVHSTSNKGICNYTLTAHVTTGHEVLGYTWSGIGAAVIHHTHATTDGYSFSLPSGASATVSVLISVVDTNYTDTTGGGCCSAVLTQTVSCGGGERRDAPTGSAHGNTTEQKNVVTVFPNPSNDVITIISTVDEINTVEVINVDGKTMAEYKYDHTTQVNVSLGQLPPGTYMVRVNKSTSKVVSKIK